MIDYSLYLSDPRGQRLDFFGNHEWASMDLTRTVNNVGVGSFRFPYTDDWRQRYSPYNIISVYKSIDGGIPILENDTLYPILYREPVSVRGERLINTLCLDLNFLLKRRGAPWYAGSAQVSKSGAADNILKAIARENISSAANDYSGSGSARGLPASVFTVDPDLGLAQSITISFAWQSDLLKVCQEIADASRQRGTFLAWDFVARPNQAIVFRTYTGQRGADRRVLVLSEETGQLDDVRYFDDWRDEVNAVYVAGQDQATDRQVQRRIDTSRSGVSLFSWAEQIISNTQNTTTPAAHLQAIGDAALLAGRPKSGFSATFTPTPAIRYGVDLDFGDLVTCSAFGLKFLCRVSSVQTSAEANGAVSHKILFANDGTATA